MTSPLAPAPLAHRVKRLLMVTRRGLYGARAFVPGLRERHRLERMVGPLGFWRELQRYQFQALCANGLEPHHRLLDFGCGPLQGGVPVIRYLQPSKYTGIDIDPSRIETARSQIARHGLSGKGPSLLLASTLDDHNLRGRFDFIWASQILYSFEADAMAALLAGVRERLTPGGRFLGDIIGPRHYLFRFPEPKYVLHTFESLQQMAAERGLAARCLGEIAQYGYPTRLLLHSNLLIEFTLAGRGPHQGDRR